MKLFGKPVLNALSQEFPESSGHVVAWQNEVEEATWSSLGQVQERYRNAQVSSGGRVVFALLRGLYVVDTKVRCDRGIVVVLDARAQGVLSRRTTRPHTTTSRA